MFIRAFIHSRTLQRVGYDFSKHQLEIKFRNGKIYYYNEVPVKVVTDLVSAKSKGEFFNHHIRDEYETEMRTDS